MVNCVAAGGLTLIVRSAQRVFDTVTLCAGDVTPTVLVNDKSLLLTEIIGTVTPDPLRGIVKIFAPRVDIVTVITSE